MKISQFFLVFGFGLLSLNSQAQDTRTEAPVQVERQEVRHERVGPTNGKATRANNLKTKLNLTPEQTISFDEINQRYRSDIQEARQAHSGDREAMQQTAKTLRENHRQEIQAILTPEQAEIYESETSKRRPRRAVRPQQQNRG